MRFKKPRSHSLGVHLRTVRRTITTQELVDYLGVSPRTLRNWIANGKLAFTDDLEQDIKMLLDLRRVE